MATSDPKLLVQAISSPPQRQEILRSTAVGKPGREWPLTSIARSVRSTTAVLIDAVIGRYDR